MFMGMGSFLIAFLGLGFLILIHELGHCLIARRVGMKVEAFGIGFGRPLYSFNFYGVKVNICPIPFGGYVKIAGMESDKKKGSSPPKDGFFSKSPFARMAVAIGGPLFNLLFALFAFSLIWAIGGRERSYNEVTGRIGHIDPRCELYEKGVRSGDRVISYNGKEVSSSKDHLYAAMTSGPEIELKLEKIDENEVKEIFAVPYQDPRALERGILTSGIMAPAAYLVWNPPEDPSYKPMVDSCLASGFQAGDRIVWLEGEKVFSTAQLNSIINSNLVYLTILRNGTYQHLRVPKVQIVELMLPKDFYGEFSDWRYEASLQTIPFNQLWFIPYNLTPDCKVEAPLRFFENFTQKSLKSAEADSLLPGDQIVAVSGNNIHTAAELLKVLQEKKVLVVVDRVAGSTAPIAFQSADDAFVSPFRSEEMAKLIDSLGTQHEKVEAGEFVVLRNVELKNQAQLDALLGNTQSEKARKEAEAKILNSIEDPSIRPEIEKKIQMREKELYLGLYGVQDRTVFYNPNPFEMCKAIAEEIYQTGSALLGGYMSPRWMSGPVGIVQVIQQQITLGWMEVLFWLGAISLNLAVFNLFPLPVLDGGYVLLSIFEICTGMRLRAQTVEKIVLPFAIAFIGFILYLTYHDIMRIGVQIFKKWGLF